MGRPIARACVLVALCLLAACAGNQTPDEDADLLAAQEAAAPKTTVPYSVQVAVQGAEDPDLESFLLAVSEANASTDRPPPSRFALRRRADSDVTRLTAALKSKGFYDGAVAFTIEADADADPIVDDAGGEAVQPLLLTFQADPGTRYMISEVVIDATGPATDYAPPALDDLGIKAGDPADAGAILDAESKLLDAARQDGRPFAELQDRSAFINTEDKDMEVVLRIAPGDRQKIADPTFEGNEGIDETYLGRFNSWEAGDIYDPEKVRELRRELTSSGLFNAATINIGKVPDADGNLPVIVNVTQRRHRTIAAGVRYETDNGFGGNVSWTHRNLFGAGERFSADLDVSQIIQFARVRLNKGNFYHRDLTFLSESEIRREDTDAFKSNSVGASAGLEYDFNEENALTGAIRYRLSEQTQDGVTETYNLVSFPVAGRFDNTDQPLDATRGVKASLGVTPFFQVDDVGGDFQKFDASGSTYLKVIDDPRLVLAGRVRYGTITGASIGAVPPDERFYAGGGGSIRGVPFQQASPRDGNTLIGGLSLFEVSGEVRANVTETIGFVVFVDAGRAFADNTPSFSEGLLIGVGTGLRYATPVGPLRLDVGVPVNNDPDDFDDPFQLYISLGQAF